MTTAAWPGTLPTGPDSDTFTAARQDNKISFQPEVGDAKVRRRFTGTLKDFSASFSPLTDTQRGTLDTFHDTTLVDGTLPFTWTDPESGDAGVFRFVSPPSWTSLGPLWKVNCSIRRLS